MPFLSTLITSGLVAAGAGAIGGGALIIAPTAGGLALAATGTAALVQGIVSIGLTIGASYGASLLNSALAQKQPVQRNDITIKQALPNRFIDIGRVKTAGALVYIASPGLYLHTVKVLSCCKIQEIEKIYLDDYPTVNAAINAGAQIGGLNGPWFFLTLVEARLGADDQTALGLPQAAGSWTTAHRLRGMSAIAATYAQGDKKNFQTAYPNGPPSPAAVIKGAMLPDPRNEAQDMEDPSTWTYSDNFASAVLRYLLDRDGWGLPAEEIDFEIAAQACDDCDDDVDTTTGTEPRYRAWGRYTTAEDRSSTLKDMLAAGAATVIEQPSGKLGLFVGKTRSAAVTISADQMIDIQLERFPDALSRIDGVKPRIVWEGASWQEQEVPAVLTGGPYYGAAPDIEDMPLNWCPSPYQGQRVGKARLKRARCGWQGTITTWLVGLRCCGEPLVHLVIPELEIDDDFEITSQPALDVGSMTVSIGVRSFDPDTFEMPATEMGEMSEAAVVDEDYTVPAPEGLEYVISGGDVVVTWDTITDESAYTSEAAWRLNDPLQGADDGWNVLSASAGTSSFSAVPSTTFDFRCRRVSSRGYESEWAVLPEIEVP